MDNKLLMGIMAYYLLLSMFFFLGGSTIFADTGEYENMTFNLSRLNMTDLSGEESENTDLGIGRFLGLMTIGIGIPESYPTWFRIGFIYWQSIISILTLALIYAALRQG